MKNNFKKIIVGIFGFALLFTAQNAFAANWNSDPNDCQNTVAIANYTTNTGYGSCWPSTSMSAEPGDIINVRIYYHNTSNTVARNVRLAVTKSSNSSTSHNFTGRIMSDNGDLSGNVNLSVSSSQSISFIDARWFPNQSRTQVPLPNGQLASTILSTGILIGDVASGWESQGTIVAVFKVSSNVTPSCSISSFSASPTSITAGNSSTLSWITNNCTSVNISNVGSVNTSGSRTVSPTNTTTYILTASGASGSTQSRSATVTVNQPQLCQDPNALNYHGPLPCVYPPAPTCTISNFQATPTSITAGNSSTLSWITSSCASVSISPNIGTFGPVGNKVVYPSVTTSYTLKAYSELGVLGDTDTVTVFVNTPSVMTGNLTASNYSCTITSGNSTCAIPFSWTTQNPEATSAVTHNGVTVASGNNGSKTLNISKGTQNYYLYNNSKLLDTETVNATCALGTSWNGSVCAPVVIDTCNIDNFQASPTSITSGSFSTLSWITNNCTSVNISNVGSVNTSGSRTVYPTNTTTYTLTAYSLSGVAETRTVTVYVNQESICSINNFTASDTNIEYGDSSVLSWNTSDCVSVTISNLGQNVPTSGSQTVWPSYTKSYTLNAYGVNGISQSRSVTIYVDDNGDNDDECRIDNFTASDTRIDDGDSTTLRWSTTDCDHVSISKIGSVDDDGSEKVYPSRDTIYTLTAYNSNGNTETESVKIYVDEDNNNNDDECYINSFTTNKIYINSGDAVTLRWSTTDCDDVDISGVDNNLDDDGSETIYPTSTRTYTLRASGDEGDDSRSITINVNNYYNPVTPIYNANVVTTVATNISQTGAQVNGLITSSNYTNENVYFEYGTTVNMGARTSSRTTNGNTNFSEYLTNLSPNTIYYFQALSDGPNGVSRGAIQVFKTLGYTTPVNPVQKVVVQGPTVTTSASPIMLRIENKYQTIGIGDIVDYTVYYKNISKSKLTDPMVQVFIPQGITLTNISNGTYSESDRTLSVPIADLNPSDEGVIYLQGRVDDLDANLAQIVTTAILIYTNPNGAQENAMAYVLNNPKVVNLLGASAFFGNMSGISLIGLLFLVIVILLLALVARSIIGRRNQTVIHNH